MKNLKLNKLLIGLVSVALLAAVGCGDDDENNAANNANNQTTNNQTTNNETTNNETTNNQTTNNETTPGATARLQVIHNSPDPAASSVDVYVNGELYIDDFAFRTATGFVEVPAGVELNVDVAPATASDGDGAAERLNPEGAFTYTLDADSYTTIVASGVLNPAEFTPNGNEIAFDLIVIPDQKLTPETAGTIGVRVLHGAPDAPAVDALLADGTAIVDGASYGDFTPYLPVPGAGVVTLDITTDDQQTFVDAYQTTGGVADVTAVAAASGFLDPDANQDGPGFGLYVFLASDATDTTASPGIPLPRAARAQIIHNSADPAAENVDIFVNDVETVPNVAFRTATSYVTFPSGVDLEIDVAPAADGNTSADRVNADGQFVFNLPAGSTSTIIANGVLDPTQFQANPTGNDIAFNLYAIDGREASTSDDEFQFNTFHGATDAPAIDVALVDDPTTLLIDNLSYGNATGYQGVVSGSYNIALKGAGAPIEQALATYNVPADGFLGQAGTVVASGFLTPDDGTDPAVSFRLLLFLPTGGAAIPVPTGN